MAEVPEIETLRRDLDREVGGKRIKTVEIPGSGVIPRHTNKKQFVGLLEGTKINSVVRRDLLLVAKLDSGDALVVDISGGGQLRRHAAKDALDKATKVVVTFTQGGHLRAVDTSGNLEAFVVPFDQLTEAVPALGTLGVDVLDEPVSWTVFGERILRHRNVKLRALLMDRTVVAGVGPVYADEILHASGLRPDRDVASLSTQEIRRFFRAVVETLHESAKHRGVTTADGQYADLTGKPGGWTAELQVFERDGKACLRCRGVVSKVRQGNKPVYLCESCQV
ncbi:MAG TPA: DNA-formamidopyrimidine glycosylase family protein [Aquihabitans sp.]|jgi:formamidopyrimidine-DNA glycosylase|nr:DNA-formamidopyrimidine glycosylase family protein [Aquihabitans sp.]